MMAVQSKQMKLGQDALLVNPLLRKLAARIEEGQSLYRWTDLYLAQYVADCHGQENTEPVILVVLAIALASQRGRVSIDLASMTGGQFHGLKLPAYSESEWIRYLKASSAVQVIDDEVEIDSESWGSQGQLFSDDPKSAPLALHNQHLYLSRYWALQCRINDWLEASMSREEHLTEAQWQALAGALKELFNLDQKANEIDWQACAAAQALTQSVSLISGGPGTGKTTTAAKVLHLLSMQHRMKSGGLPKIRLLAPTGKAAIRLCQSIRGWIVNASSELNLPESGETIHRFLYGVGRGQRFSVEDSLLVEPRETLADVDIVLVDEASMIDLVLMARLVSVLPERAKVILMGDHHQLPAVEPGQIFADWVRRYESRPYGKGQAERVSRLASCNTSLLEASGDEVNPVCRLRKTYRFSGDLKRIADAFRESSADEVLTLLEGYRSDISETVQLSFYEPEDLTALTKLARSYDAYFNCINEKSGVETVAAAFSEYQVLCSTHEGPQGTKALNALIENHYGKREDQPYHGKAIMVLENYTNLGVFNGDIGFFVEKAPGSYVLAFPEVGEELVELAPASIRAWQPAYAITVHKSQGSEYRHISLILPDYAKELLTRAMLYTGVTRAKLMAELWVSAGAVAAAMNDSP